MKGIIDSVDDALESIDNQKLERGKLLFRGHSNHTWELQPSLLRSDRSYAASFEAATFESLLNGKRNHYATSNDPLEHLIFLQHYSVPTRLLDWTSDILIALFFACYDEKSENLEHDGKLFTIFRDYFPKLNTSDNEIFKQPFEEKTVADLFKKRLYFDDIYIIDPLIKNPRMRFQDGCCMLFPFISPDNNSLSKFITLPDYLRIKNKAIRERNNKLNEMQQREEEIWRAEKLVNKSNKLNILKELEIKYGICKETIFVETEFTKNIEIYYNNIKCIAIEKANWIRSQRPTSQAI